MGDFDMRQGNLRSLAWAPLAICVVAGPIAVMLFAANPNEPIAPEASAAYLVGLLAFPLVGALIASRHPNNPIGWILSGAGLITMFQIVTSAYAEFGFSRQPHPTGTVVTAWFADVVWLPSIAVSTAFLFLLFPTGRLPSRRWRPIAWLAVGGTVLNLAGQWFEPTLYSHPDVRAPFALNGPIQSVANALVGFGFFFLLGGMIGAVVSLIIRLRRSRGEERQQIKWFVYSAGIVILALLPTFFLEEVAEGISVFAVAGSFLGLLIPISIGFAVLKYRLYDIDVVINKTVVYGALAGFITLVYVGIVVGIGTAIGQGGRPNLGLSILATAVVAVAFQPVRERVQRLANRLVYGRRATPYEVLSHFADRMSSTYATDDLLPQMVAILREGTGAARAQVWLRVGGDLRRVASSPLGDAVSTAELALSGDQIPEIPGAHRSVSVRHQRELLGALVIAKGPGEPVTPTEDKLMNDLASQAGLVLRNVKLIEELRASRQRIVSAQDEERRRIERNIHDGAQQQLVALNVKLGLVRTLVSKDAEKAQELIEQVQSETREALENLRDLARGIYPPLLADQGLAPALEAQARKAPVPVRVETDGVGRFDRDAEAAVYFCILEALQNVAKYARASQVMVRVSIDDEQLAFAVHDDGVGFDPNTTPPGSGLTNMADRIDALGGTLEVTSEPSSGTTVSGRVPARAAVAA